jgi:hypothetical protein
MEGTGGGILGRLGEKVLGWIALALIVALGFGLYKIGAPGRQALWGAIWRTSLWVAVVGALPWTIRLFIRRILELSSNWAGVAVIGSYVVLDALLGVILLNGFPAGGWGWLLTLAALALAGTYNFLVAEYLSEQTGL